MTVGHPLDTPPETLDVGSVTRLDVAVRDDVADGLGEPELRLLIAVGALPHVATARARYVALGDLDALNREPDSLALAARALWLYLSAAPLCRERSAALAHDAPLWARSGTGGVELRVRPPHMTRWLIRNGQERGFRLPMTTAVVTLIGELGSQWRRMATPLDEVHGQKSWASYALPTWVTAMLDAHPGELA